MHVSKERKEREGGKDAGGFRHAAVLTRGGAAGEAELRRTSMGKAQKIEAIIQLCRLMCGTEGDAELHLTSMGESPKDRSHYSAMPLDVWNCKVKQSFAAHRWAKPKR